MKKRAISLLLASILMLALALPAFAATPPSGDDPQASAYLSSYAIALSQEPNYQIDISVSVNATKTMSRVGVSKLEIDKKVYNSDGSYYWSTVETRYGMDDPTNYYQYNTAGFANSFSFTGTAGTTYRAVATVMAANSSGSDAGSITSYSLTCYYIASTP